MRPPLRCGDWGHLQAPGRPACHSCSCTLSHLLIIAPQSAGVFVGVPVPLGRLTSAVLGNRLRRELRAGGSLASIPGSRAGLRGPHPLPKPTSLAASFQGHSPRTEAAPQHSPGVLRHNLPYLPQTLTGHWAGHCLRSPSPDPWTCSTAARSPSPTPHPLCLDQSRGRKSPEAELPSPQ